MPELSPLLTLPRPEALYYNTETSETRSHPLVCPHCQMLCQAIGKINNSWYTLCKCGTYIQICEYADDYRD